MSNVMYALYQRCCQGCLCARPRVSAWCARHAGATTDPLPCVAHVGGVVDGRPANVPFDVAALRREELHLYSEPHRAPRRTHSNKHVSRTKKTHGGATSVATSSCPLHPLLSTSRARRPCPSGIHAVCVHILRLHVYFSRRRSRSRSVTAAGGDGGRVLCVARSNRRLSSAACARCPLLSLSLSLSVCRAGALRACLGLGEAVEEPQARAVHGRRRRRPRRLRTRRRGHAPSYVT